MTTHSNSASILVAGPIIASFVLFHQIARNPNNAQVKEYQILLEIAAGYWLRLSMASAPVCIGAEVAELATIARDLHIMSTSQQTSTGHDVYSQQIPPASSGVNSASQPDSDSFPSNLTSINDANELLDPNKFDPWYGNWDFDADVSWTDYTT
jgi:hypothetical protein